MASRVPAGSTPATPTLRAWPNRFIGISESSLAIPTIYDMEIFQEGGAAGDVPVGEAAKRIQVALEKAHPGALWMMMAWQDNPMPAVMEAVDTRRVLVADIEQGRIPA